MRWLLPMCSFGAMARVSGEPGGNVVCSGKANLKLSPARSTNKETATEWRRNESFADSRQMTFFSPSLNLINHHGQTGKQFMLAENRHTGP